MRLPRSSWHPCWDHLTAGLERSAQYHPDPAVYLSIEAIKYHYGRYFGGLGVVGHAARGVNGFQIEGRLDQGLHLLLGSIVEDKVGRAVSGT